MSGSNLPEGTSVAEVKTETSPLKDTGRRKINCFDNFLCNCEFDNTGSLKTIVVILFGTTAAVTLALLTQVYYGEYEVEPHGSVSTDSEECSHIGVNVLQNGGNAVDAAVAAAVCLGVTNFHITGLGGGGYLMVYNHKKHRLIDSIDFRESVPLSYNLRKLNLLVDGMAIGVPGFVKGLWEAHSKHGRLPWKDLIMPAANLAKHGFKVSGNVVSSTAYINSNGYNMNLMEFMRQLHKGENVTMPELATTLEKIADEGADVFYNGTIAMDIVYSVKLANGNMSADDIAEYRVSDGSYLKTKVGGFDVVVPDASSGGALLLNSLDSIQILDLNEETDTPADIILKMSDVLHDTYLSFLQKTSAFTQQPEAVASEVSVVDNAENYVTIVSGLNTWLGSQILTNAGFILNNALIRGGVNNERRPVSLASPIIAVQSDETCGQRFILGSGDVTVAAQVLTNLLLFKKSTVDSVEYPRFNIDNVPRHIRLEDYHSPTFSLDSISHLKPKMTIESVRPPYKSINVIEKLVDSIMPYSDSRGGGRSAQFRR